MTTALTDAQKITLVKLTIGDIPGNPFYPMFQDSDYEMFLSYNGGVVNRTVRMAAISASMYLSTINYKEMVADEEIWTNVGKDYQAALKELISEKSINNLPDGLKPYASGISWGDMLANNQNPDNVRPSLTTINNSMHYIVFVNRRILEWPLIIV